MSKLDELFREKLDGHSVTPSKEVWTKIEAGLSKQNRPYLWLRWAAVFLLGGLLLSVLLIQRREVPVLMTVSKPDLKTERKPAVVQPIQALAQEPKEEKKGTGKNTTAPQVVEPLAQGDQDEKEISQPSRMEAAAVAETSLPAGVNESLKAPSSIVLIYTLEPVEEAAPAPATVASAEKKDSSLKKVLDFASTVKNGDSPLDNLRNAKEELFALDFKKKANSKKQ